MSQAIQKNISVSLRRAIKRAYGDELDEVVDGMKIAAATKMVDLSVGYTPVVLDRWRDDDALHDGDIPTPVRVVTDGKKFAAVYGLRFPGGKDAGRDFCNLSDETHRTCRARYLLIRGLIYRKLDSVWPWSFRQQVIAMYLPGVWRPNPGTKLYKALGLS